MVNRVVQDGYFWAAWLEIVYEVERELARVFPRDGLAGIVAEVSLEFVGNLLAYWAEGCDVVVLRWFLLLAT